MAIAKIKARDFSLRGELEKAVIGLVVNSNEAKPEFIITGKREELKRLHLDETSTIYGVKCEVTDGAKPKKEKSTADRGVLHKFGINNIRNNPK